MEQTQQPQGLANGDDNTTDDKRLPSTPHRGRGLYPSNLAKGAGGPGRVPLHKRGTSRTYERLEDLLREAGYKETRIFTPETDRFGDAAEADKDEQQQPSGVARMSAVLSFVSGLVSWGDGGSGEDDSAEGLTRTQSLGRAALKNAHQRRGRLDDDLWSPTSPTPASKQHHPQPRKPFAPLTKQPDSGSNGHGGSSSTSSMSPNLLPPRPRSAIPDARTALRHMMSTPEFLVPQRSDLNNNSTRVQSHSVRKSHAHAHGQSNSRPVGHATQNTPPPPMPSNWLQTVTQAVLRTSPASGAHVGVPAAGYASDRGRTCTSQHTLRHARPSIRRDASTTSTRKLLPVQAVRAASSPSVVTTTSVVCRSAPGSRASSRVRDRDGRAHHNSGAGGGGYGAHGGGGGGGKKQRGEIVRVPSLGATAVSNLQEIDAELWGNYPMTPTSGPLSTASSSTSGSGSSAGAGYNSRHHPHRQHPHQRPHPPHIRIDTTSAHTSASASASTSTGFNLNSPLGRNDADDSDTDSESGELDLARMLVPPKRQQSIRSLRRCLHAAMAAEAHAHAGASTSGGGGTGVGVGANGGVGSVRGRRPRSSHGREGVEGVYAQPNHPPSSFVDPAPTSMNVAAKPRRDPRVHHSHAHTLKIAPGLRGEFADEESSDALHAAAELRRARRGSGEDLVSAAAAGSHARTSRTRTGAGADLPPGMQQAKRERKGAKPWNGWA